jgi:hypothetical protein
VHKRWPAIKIILVSGAIEPSEHRSSPVQQILRQATPSLANHSPDAQHDRSRLKLVVLVPDTARIPQRERSARNRVRHPVQGDRVANA